MNQKWYRLLEGVFLLSIFLSIGLHELHERSRFSLLNEKTVESSAFRSQPVTEDMISFIQPLKNPGEILGIYWLESRFINKPPTECYSKEFFKRAKQAWSRNPAWESYSTACCAIWDDLEYFPVPESSNEVNAEVSYVDSWMYERNYGGTRGHEGTDIMASENVRGFYPVVSMTDGIVQHKGWLEQGGYRIGITAPGGAYFYYAHLDSYADLEIGDTVKAGQLLGFMGDTGYSKVEGTTGNFPVHLHVGIYLTDTGKEISVNPYPALRYLESRKIKCAYERG